MSRQSAQQATDDRPRNDERYGPVAVMRARKDDGRALLLYSHEESDDVGDPSAGPERIDGDDRSDGERRR